MPLKKRGVRVTVYLPDDLRNRAKAEGLNLSRLLRDAVERQLDGEARTAGVELERVGETTLSRSLRIQVPKVLLTIYEIRNNRGVGHVGGEGGRGHRPAGGRQPRRRARLMSGSLRSAPSVRSSL